MAIFKSMIGRETKILVEMHERTIIRPLPEAVHGFCEECGAESMFLVTERAAIIAGVTVREIYRRVERSAVHFIESSGGPALICRTSLTVDGQEITVGPLRPVD